MKTFNISINDELVEIVTREMKRKKYANRSEFFRDLIRRHYLENSDNVYAIESVGKRDDDFATLEERDKEEDLTPLSELIG